jgi:hypothetical protein
MRLRERWVNFCEVARNIGFAAKGRHWVRFWGGATCRGSAEARKEQPPPLQGTRPTESARAPSVCSQFQLMAFSEAPHQCVNRYASAMDDYKTYLAEQIISEENIVRILSHGLTDSRPLANS